MTQTTVFQPKILVCGTPRLWREMLGHVLQARLGTQAVGEIGETEPLMAASPTVKSEWLIWCLSSGEELQNVLAHMSFAAKQPNLMLIASDGNAIVHWADRPELRRQDISLEELVGILMASNLPVVG